MAGLCSRPASLLLLHGCNAEDDLKREPVTRGNSDLGVLVGRLLARPTREPAFMRNKKSLLAAAAILVLPAAGQAQSLFGSSVPAYPGFYIGAEGALNWLLNNNSYIMNAGWAAGGKIGYDFVGPRLEVEALYHSNYGSGVRAFPNGYATINGQIQQVSLMANLLYDFFPAAVVTPYIGGGLGVAFVDNSIQGC